MRLRRETGDFQIKVTIDNGTPKANTLTPNLLGEDFVGQIVDANGTMEVVTKASENKLAGTVTAVCESYSLSYNKTTGAVTPTAVSP